MPTFGPGLLTIGEVGSELDVSCLVNGAKIAASKDQGDDTTKLCGTIKPGKITYTYALSGNFDVDSEDPDGIFALSQLQPGSQQPFVFTPSTAGETSAAGTLIVDPLDFGADTFGDDMTSDFEFALVGPPTYTFPDAAPLADRFAPVVVNGAGTTSAGTPAADAA
jgi:hypothetical protein